MLGTLPAGCDPDASPRRALPATPPWAQRCLTPVSSRRQLDDRPGVLSCRPAAAAPASAAAGGGGERRRMLGGGVAVAALLVVAVCATTTATGGAEEPKRSVLRSASRVPFFDDASPTDAVATVLVIRHCDKDPESSSPHCTPRGYRRAAWLPTLFGDRGDERFKAPSYVFARRPESNKKKKRPVVRSVETVTPLAETFGVAIDDTYGVDTERDLSTRVREMVRDGDLTGGLAVVCWKHEQIPQLAYDLGWHTSSKKRTKWKADDYDSIIELTYTRWTDGYWRVDGKRKHEDFHDTPPV